MKKFWIMRLVKGFVLFVLFGALFGYVVMGLWNWLMPLLFGVNHLITFWEALGIIILCKLLFGGFGHGRWGGRHCGGHSHWKGGGFWKEKWEDKLSHMSPEEREKVKAEWEKRCRYWGHGYSKEETPSSSDSETKM